MKFIFFILFTASAFAQDGAIIAPCPKRFKLEAYPGTTSITLYEDGKAYELDPALTGARVDYSTDLPMVFLLKNQNSVDPLIVPRFRVALIPHQGEYLLNYVTHEGSGRCHLIPEIF